MSCHTIAEDINLGTRDYSRTASRCNGNSGSEYLGENLIQSFCKLL